MLYANRMQPSGIRWPELNFDSKDYLDQGPRYIVSCTAGRNWSLSGIYAPADATEHADIAEAVAWELAARGIQTALAPSVAAMSGRMVAKSNLVTCIDLPYGVEVYRNRHLPSDGLMLDPGDAFIGSFGGCAAIVVIGRSPMNGKWYMFVAHAGCKSLIDRNLIEHGEASRKHGSVIDAIVSMASTLGIPAEALTLRFFFAIPYECFMHRFEDTDHGPYNVRLTEHLRATYGNRAARKSCVVSFVDIGEIIVAQAQGHGMRVERTPGLEYLPEEGAFPHTRLMDRTRRDDRSLVIVQRVS